MSLKKSNNISFNAYEYINQLNNLLIQINKDNNKTIPEKECLNLNISINKNKLCLFLKKLYIGENKNIYYNKALENLFYNKNNFLNDKYEGKKEIIGKKNRKNEIIKEIHENIQFHKRRKSTSAKTDIKSLTVFFAGLLFVVIQCIIATILSNIEE